MKFIKTDDTEVIADLRSQLYQTLTAPIDAMWELLYIASAQDFLITENDTTIGYCSISDDHCLLQLFLIDAYQVKMNTVISDLIESNLITSARLSSNEPMAFNTCLMLSKEIKSNTFCFQHVNTPRNITGSLPITLATPTEIQAIKYFLKEQVGMDDTFGYTENLVDRKEIFLVKESNVVIATNECRRSDTQPEITDLGVIVHKDFQGKGIATQIMNMQVNEVLKTGRKPICSTTIDNKASKKMIEKAGFYCSNIIFDIRFTDD